MIYDRRPSSYLCDDKRQENLVTSHKITNADNLLLQLRPGALLLARGPRAAPPPIEAQDFLKRIYGLEGSSIFCERSRPLTSVDICVSVSAHAQQGPWRGARKGKRRRRKHTHRPWRGESRASAQRVCLCVRTTSAGPVKGVNAHERRCCHCTCFLRSVCRCDSGLMAHPLKPAQQAERGKKMVLRDLPPPNIFATYM